VSAPYVAWAVYWPIVDKTGLSGTYDYEVVLFAQSSGQPGQRGQPSNSTSNTWPSPEDFERMAVQILSDRLEDQLGLRLEPQKAVPFRVLVIDHVEKPSAN
jgi:uncharacterized protein (TIGR03435 family)